MLYESLSIANLVCKVLKKTTINEYINIGLVFFPPNKNRSPIRVPTVTSEDALCDRIRINESCVAKNTGIGFVNGMIFYSHEDD